MVNLPVISSLFDWIILSSLMGTILICLILSVKFVFKHKLGANWHYYIWFLLLLRLIIPFTPQSPVSIYNLLNQNSQNIHSHNIYDYLGEAKHPAIGITDATGISARNADYRTQNNQGVAGSLNDHRKSVDMNDSDRRNIFIIIWLAGVFALATYTLIINLKLLYKIKSEPIINNSSIIAELEECKSSMNISKRFAIVTTRQVSSPALFGLINPILLLPDSMVKSLGAGDFNYIALHELAHWKRKDVLINWITVILQILHWFNPVIWYGFYRMRHDCELSCDALVLSRLAPEKHKEYGHTIIRLLEMTIKTQWIPGTAGILTGKPHIKRRVSMIANFKKESHNLTVAALILFIVMGVLGCTNAQDSKNPAARANIDESSYNQLLGDLKNNQIVAGTADVEGPGIIVNLSDQAADNNTKGIPEHGLLVHDTDILLTVNELIKAGAEAISINDERLIASSEIECTGDKIRINGTPCNNPYVIKAIGNSEKMLETLESKGGYIEFFRELGFGANIEKSDNLFIPKYNGELNFKYARVKN